MASFSVLPSLVGRNWWDAWDRPSSIVDQFFGVGLSPEDFLSPPRYQAYYIRPPRQLRRRETGLSTVTNDPNNFSVSLDVSHFSPSELTVKTVDNHVMIHGKHEERADEHGFISREFTRRYMLPAGVDADTVTSSLSPEGILTVQSPKKLLEPASSNERVVPITMQETPAVAPETSVKEQEKPEDCK